MTVQMRRIVAFRNVVALCCGYELAAILANQPDRFPTITAWDKRTKHAVAPLVIGGLIVHFFEEELRALRKEKIVRESN